MLGFVGMFLKFVVCVGARVSAGGTGRSIGRFANY